MCLKRIPHGQYPVEVWNTFYYNDKIVRTVFILNQLWWMLSDVCNVIGLSNASSVAARLADAEKMTLTQTSSHSGQRGGARKVILVNVFGLCHLLDTSYKPAAKAFRRWTMTEAMPSIFQNGGYIMGQGTMDAAELINASQQVAQNILVERDQRMQDLRIQNKAQAMLLREWQPKARYYNATLQAPKLLTTTLIASEYGTTAQWLNNYLQENGVQYKSNGTWVLCEPYADKGFTYPQTRACDCNRYTHWTQKGRAFLHDFLRDDGILPLSERTDVPVDIEDFWLL